MAHSGNKDLEQVYHGFFALPGLTLFAEIGLADLWAKGEAVELQRFCSDHILQPDIVLPLAKYFQLHGYLDESGGLYRATPLGREFFTTWPGAMIYTAYAPLLAELIPITRKQKTYGPGRDVYRDMYLDTKGSGAVGIRFGMFQRVVSYMVNSRHSRLLDLGCGDGTFLRFACEQFPALHAIGIDVSQVALESARHQFREAGLERRGTFLQGDLLRPADFLLRPEIQGVELVTVFYILHEVAWEGLDKVREFLRQYREHLGHARLAVAEIFRPEDDRWKDFMGRTVPELVLYHDLSHQRLLPKEQWLALYHEEGFRVVETLEAPSDLGPSVFGTVILERA